MCPAHVVTLVAALSSEQGVVKPSVSRQLVSLNRYSVTSRGDEEGQVVIGNAGGLEELTLGELIGSGECRMGEWCHTPIPASD